MGKYPGPEAKHDTYPRFGNRGHQTGHSYVLVFDFPNFDKRTGLVPYDFVYPIVIIFGNITVAMTLCTHQDHDFMSHAQVWTPSPISVPECTTASR